MKTLILSLLFAFSLVALNVNVGSAASDYYKGAKYEFVEKSISLADVNTLTYYTHAEAAPDPGNSWRSVTNENTEEINLVKKVDKPYALPADVGDLIHPVKSKYKPISKYLQRLHDYHPDQAANKRNIYRSTINKNLSV